ncbi:MAG TPA: AMP-binding protein [Bacteroidales bacterium]|nr:AMP-binding protein [Bacteroidales bacterium]
MGTIVQLFEDSVAKYSGNPFLWEKIKDQYQSLTYAEIHQQVIFFAKGLLSLGLRRGERVAMLLEGRTEWVVSELGILYCAAVNVPLSVKLNEPDELLFRLKHSGAKFVITSGYQAKKIVSLLPSLPLIEKIIVVDDEPLGFSLEISYKEVVCMGKNAGIDIQSELEKRIASILPDDSSTICYTSGTTADPKGIILSHGNYYCNTTQALGLIAVPSYFVTLLILPWDHSFAHTAGIYTVAKAGASLAAVQSGKTPLETLKNIPVNIKEVRPHFLLSVPALAKNFRKNIESAIQAKGVIVQWLFTTGLKTAYLYNGNGYNKGKGWRVLFYLPVRLFDAILFKKIRENFGGRLQFFVGGGALLDIELQRFFYAIGIPMLQGYGLTEASPIISANSLTKHKLGSSGSLVPNMDFTIRDENGQVLPQGEKGEIVIKGGNVMSGYWQNEEATRQTIKDGWLYSGDMGYLDKDNFLYVLGRFKSLLIADDGEKYSPEGIEEAMVSQSSFIEQCMLYNNQKPYTVALIVPNIVAIKRKLSEHHHTPTPEAVLKLIESEVNEYRTGRKFGHMFPQRWLPAAIGVLNEPFTEENHMLNSTLKMVRGKVVERYEKLIIFLYTPEAKNVCNSLNMASAEKLLKN